MEKYKCLHCGEIIEPNDRLKHEVRYYCNTKCRLLRKMEEIKKRSYLRFQINNRDAFTCAFCGRSSYLDGATLSTKRISIDSKVSIDNIVTCCSSCLKNMSLLISIMMH